MKPARLLEQIPIAFPAEAPPLDLKREDMARIARQRKAVFDLMASGAWLTLAEVAEMTGHPEASVSARIRDFRKVKFGGHIVDRRRRRANGGQWEYRLEVTP